MRWIKKVWHNVLVFLRIRRNSEYLTKKNTLKHVRSYQQADLAFLQNLMLHIDTAEKRFSPHDKLKADFRESVVKFKE